LKSFVLYLHLPRLWLVLLALFRFALLVALSAFGTAVEEKDGEEKVLATSTVATIKASAAIAVLVVVVVVVASSCGVVFGVVGDVGRGLVVSWS
jgi:hypothetical protein